MLLLNLVAVSVGASTTPMHPSSLKTKITTARLAKTRDFYVSAGVPPGRG
jgi:hypothetical protein